MGDRNLLFWSIIQSITHLFMNILMETHFSIVCEKSSFKHDVTVNQFKNMSDLLKKRDFKKFMKLAYFLQR